MTENIEGRGLAEEGRKGEVNGRAPRANGGVSRAKTPGLLIGRALPIFENG